MTNNKEVPKALRTWFIIHFAADIIFAVPLLIFPVKLLTIIGWQSVDPVSARLVAAALFGVGIESLLSRKASVDAYGAMLSLKIIWSLGAVAGLALSLIQGAQGRPAAVWILLIVFAAFNLLWGYWKIRVSGMRKEEL